MESKIEITHLPNKVPTTHLGLHGRHIFVGDIGYNDDYLHEIIIINNVARAVRLRKKALQEQDILDHQPILKGFWHCGEAINPKSITIK